jgi:hypothetical protein
VQNSTAVFQLSFSNDISFCASISRPNAKPQNVVCLESTSKETKKKNAVKYMRVIVCIR